MSRQRVTSAYVERLAAELPKRDLSLVETLDRFRVATAAQLRRLHFTSGTEAANARQVWRRLRALTDLRVVTVLERRIGGGRGGSTQAVYALDVAGQKLGAACGPAGGRRLRRPWTPGNQFLAHSVAVTELYVVLCERARDGGGEVLAFDAEPLCWRRFTGSGGAAVWLKPDAFVRFGAGELRTPELRRGRPGHRFGPDGGAQARPLPPLLADRPRARALRCLRPCPAAGSERRPPR